MSSALQSAMTSLQQKDYVTRMLVLTHGKSISQLYPAYRSYYPYGRRIRLR